VVGGASTSELHTAVYLNPLYDGGVYHAKDASHGAEVVRQLMSGGQGNLFVEETQMRYLDLKTTYENKRRGVARNAPTMTTKIIDWCPTTIANPEKTKVEKLQNFPLENLVPYIDWRYFFHAWELTSHPRPTGTPASGGDGTDEDPSLRSGQALRASAEQQKLRDDAEVLLKKIVDEKLLTANAAYGIFDGVCVFACTAGIGVDVLVEEFEKSGDTYSALLVQTLADRLAEAFAEYLNREKFLGKRVAVGYPSYPDHSKKKELFDLLNDGTDIDPSLRSGQAPAPAGITLTETFMMVPVASVCGLIFPQ